MRTTLFFNILFVLIIIVCIATSLHCYYDRKIHIDRLQNIENKKNSEINDIKIKYQQVLFQQMKASNERINPIWNIYSVNDEKIKITSLVDQGKKLFLRVPANSCGLCYDLSLKTIGEMMEIVGKQNFVVLLPRSRGREFMTFFKENNCGDALFYFTDDDLAISMMDNNSIPFFFTIFPDLTCHHHLYLDKEPNEFLFEYLVFIKENYLN